MNEPRRASRRGLWIFGSLAIAILASGCAAEAPQNWFRPAGPVAEMQLSLFTFTLWLMLGIFAAVGGVLVYTLVRFRERPAVRPAVPAGVAERETAAAADAGGDGAGRDLPLQFHGNHRLEVILTLIPTLIVILIAIPTVRLSFGLAAPPPGDPLQVRVVGHQWWWEFEYPELGITTANELRIPVGRPIQLTVESNDVIHSFWVPQLGGKLDAIPKRVNETWLQADREGVFFGQCAELCGTAHAKMRFRVIAQHPDAFARWAREWGSPPAARDEQELASIERGQEIFMTRACFACHAIEGTRARGIVGPNLTGLGSRLTLAAGILDNTPENLARWIEDPQAVKPGAKMPKVPLTKNELQDVVRYLHSLK